MPCKNNRCTSSLLTFQVVWWVYISSYEILKIGSLPFPDDDNPETFKRAQHGKIDFSDPCWKNVSEEGTWTIFCTTSEMKCISETNGSFVAWTGSYASFDGGRSVQETVDIRSHGVVAAVIQGWSVRKRWSLMFVMRWRNTDSTYKDLNSSLFCNSRQRHDLFDTSHL